MLLSESLSSLTKALMNCLIYTVFRSETRYFPGFSLDMMMMLRTIHVIRSMQVVVFLNLHRKYPSKLCNVYLLLS